MTGIRLIIVVLIVLITALLLGPGGLTLYEDGKKASSIIREVGMELSNRSVKRTNVAPFSKSKTLGYSLVKNGNRYDVYLSDSIGRPALYSDLLKGLKKLTVNDNVVIHMANNGGRVDAGVQIINAMKSTEATVTVELEGPSYSMGALITCAADRIVVHPYTFLMFHHYSGTFTGKGAESRKYMDALDIMVRNIMSEECGSKGILTETQIDNVIKGMDVYIHPKDIGIRKDE